MDKIYYFFYKANITIEKNSYDLKNPSLFPLPEEDDVENGYVYPDSSTEESNTDEDVGPRYDLDDPDKCSDTYSDNLSKDWTLTRKLLHVFKRQLCVIKSDFVIFACIRKDMVNRNIRIHWNASERAVNKPFLHEVDANMVQVISDL